MPHVDPNKIPYHKQEELLDRFCEAVCRLKTKSLVKDFLKAVGYEDILTGNAESFDYETTVIQYKKNQESIKDFVSEDIQSEIEDTIKFEVLAEDEAADVVIIVGTDFK